MRTLFASSISELQLLLQCQLELAWLDMCINTKKSCRMRICYCFDVDYANITSLDGTSLSWIRELRYLGVFLISSRKFKCSLDHAKRALYRAANAIVDKVARAATEEVVLHLVISKCYPVLLYGLEACTFSKDGLRNNFTATRFFMTLFCTSNSLVIADCQAFFEMESPSVRLEILTC